MPFATAMVLNQEKFIFVGADADAIGYGVRPNRND